MTLLYGRELRAGAAARSVEYLMAGEHTYCSASASDIVLLVLGTIEKK